MNSIFAKISSRENISNSLFAKFSSRENKVLYSTHTLTSNDSLYDIGGTIGIASSGFKIV